MKLVPIGSICAVFILTASFTLNQSKPWPVPEKAAKTANPVKSSASSISSGKALWVEHCASCHGKTGLGDGNKAAQLKTQPADFTKGAVQSQPDGALFYKISEGRGDMPSFKKKIPEKEEIWDVVNYMRKLKK